MMVIRLGRGMERKWGDVRLEVGNTHTIVIKEEDSNLIRDIINTNALERNESSLWNRAYVDLKELTVGIMTVLQKSMNE